jgi:hypothetical protein
MARIYFYDIDTCEELASYVLDGTCEAGIYGGRRYTGTHLGYSVLDGRRSRCIRADEFGERRIAAKAWYGPRRSEWTLLVSRERGWQGNEADVPGGTPHAELPSRLRRLLDRVKRENTKRGRAYRRAVTEAVAA